MKLNFNRRKFLEFSLKGVAGLPVLSFFNSVTGSIIANAVADGEISPTQLKYFVQFYMGGGPERWTFDGILAPNGKIPSEYIFGHTYNTLGDYLESGVTENSYLLTNSKVNEKIFMPHLWDGSVTDSVGRNVPMSEIAKEMCIIRGLYTEGLFDGHGENIRITQNPFPEVELAASIYSANPTLLKVIRGGNAESVLRAFDLKQIRESNSSAFVTIDPTKRQIRTYVNDFMGLIKDRLPQHQQKLAKKILDNREKALRMMDESVEVIKSSFSTAQSRYQTVIEASKNSYQKSSTQLRLVDDRVIAGSGPGFRTWTGQENNFSDMRSQLAAPTSLLAGSFALAEALIISRSASSLSLDAGGDFDVHETGRYHSLYRHTKYFQAFSGCLNELKTKLSDVGPEHENFWNKTMVRLYSEFNRSPTPFPDFSSNHSLYAGVETFFSGAFKDGPHLIGDIYKSTATIGTGAPCAEAGKVLLNYKFLYSTMAHAFGFEGSRNHKSLLNWNNAQLVPITVGKNV